MNATQAENLRVLIRHMETNVSRTLDMSAYFTCGAPACAAGEACMVPALAARGMAGFLENQRLETIKDVFGDVYRPLFSSTLNNFTHPRHVTPQEWALEARKVLAENGYSMDEAKPIPTVRERLDAIYAGAEALGAEEAQRYAYDNLGRIVP